MLSYFIYLIFIIIIIIFFFGGGGGDGGGRMRVSNIFLFTNVMRR